MSLPLFVDNGVLLGAETVEMIPKSLAGLCLPPCYTAAISSCSYIIMASRNIIVTSCERNPSSNLSLLYSIVQNFKAGF